ncbi:unnamed protein product, partial [Ectocarpus sp. 12 AP-2014]
MHWATTKPDRLTVQCVLWCRSAVSAHESNAEASAVCHTQRGGEQRETERKSQCNIGAASHRGGFSPLAQMHSNTRPEAVLNLVPPGRPPSGPALHTQAKNRPFALLKSLEPPRGPDYFPMEKFRRPLWPDDDRFGASGIGAGGERGHGKGPGTTSDRHISQSFANARTSQHSSPFLHTPTSGPRGTGRGMASFSPALSRASSTMMTPVQRTQQQPEGFSMFGGKAYSTP